MSLTIVHFFIQKSKPRKACFSGFLLFGFPFKNAYGRLYGKAFHQAMEFLLGEGHGFICTAGPLIRTVCQTFYDHTVSVAVEADAFDAVPLVSTEQEESPVFQRIQAILKPDDRYKPGYTSPQISSATFDNDTLTPCGVPKHSVAPSKQYPMYGPVWYRLHRPCSHQSVS